MQIVAVADLSLPRRTLLASKLGATAYPRLPELLAAEQLDGLIICSTPEHHEQAAAQAAAAGITALVEKPPAPDADGALRLAWLDPAPYCGFNRRFDQGAELARRIPATGELELHLVLHYRRASWKPLQRGEDALLDLAPHLIDLALMLTHAEPLAVRAHAARDRAGHRARDVAGQREDRGRDEPAAPRARRGARRRGAARRAFACAAAG